ncbi:UNVERIFIED_CONTAM: hypothetical protein FKN15_078023 [Acipenser sinensis]
MTSELEEEEEEEREGDEEEGGEGTKKKRKERKAARASKEAMKQLHSESQRLERPMTSELEEEEEEEEEREGDEEEGGEGTKMKRKERKAARASKEAMKQLHSESQRLVRDSSLGLPYHLPQPKTIHDFFKKRPRPACQGSAMALLRSSKYQPCISEESLDPAQNLNLNPEQAVPVETELESEAASSELPAASKAVPGPGEVELGGCSAAVETEAAPSNPQPSESPLRLPPSKPCRSSRLEKLRKLGLDPPPQPRLCADEGAFVNLDPPAVNTGEKLVLLKSKLQQAMAQRRQEERQKRAALYRLDNEDCLGGEEEEEEEMTDESEGEEEGVDFLLGEGGEEERGGSSNLGGPGRADPHLSEGTLMLFSRSCSQTGDQGGDGVRRALQTGLDGDSKLGESCDQGGDGVRRALQTGLDGDSKLEEDDSSLPSLPKENSHNSSFELLGSMIPSYQPFSKQGGRGGGAAGFRSPSPGFFKPSFLSSASKSSGKLSEPALPVEDSQDLYTASPEPKACQLGAEESQFRFSLEEETQSRLLDADGFLNVGSRGSSQYQPSKRQLILGSLDENAMDGNMGELVGLCSGAFQTQPLSQSSGKLSEPALPVEDSQDLYTASPEPKACQLGAEESQFRFSLEEETQSRLLDADGFLNVGSRGSSQYQPSKRQLILGSLDENAMDGNMGELVGLCSGAFQTQNLKDSDCTTQDSNMGELVALCSGTFQTQNLKDSDCTTQDSNMGELVGLCSGAFQPPESCGGEDSTEANMEELLGLCSRKFAAAEGSSPASLKLNPSQGAQQTGWTGVKGAAALSTRRDEELQEEEEDCEFQLMTDVGSFSSEEEDGASEGEGGEDGEEDCSEDEEEVMARARPPGFKRKMCLVNPFLPCFADEASQMDLFHGDSEEEGEEQLDEAEVQWRRQRHEREQWLREQQSQSTGGEAATVEEEEQEEIGEDSQFMKLAKKFAARALQKKGKATRTATEVNPEQQPPSLCLPGPPRGSLQLLPLQSCRLASSVKYHPPSTAVLQVSQLCEISPSFHCSPAGNEETPGRCHRPRSKASQERGRGAPEEHLPLPGELRGPGVKLPWAGPLQSGLSRIRVPHSKPVIPLFLIDPPLSQHPQQDARALMRISVADPELILLSLHA